MRMKLDNDRQRYIMRRAKTLFMGPYGAWHHEPSSFGVLILDEEGQSELQTLVKNGYLDYSPPDQRDWGYMLAPIWQNEMWKNLRAKGRVL